MPGASIARLHPWATGAAVVAPSFTVQPTDQSAGVGATATFSATVAGDPTPTLQWQMRDGSPDAPEILSVSNVTLTTASSQTPSVTVPATANAFIIGSEYYRASSQSVTFSGSGWMTVQASGGDWDFNWANNAYAAGKVTATGTQTLTVTATGTFDEGPTCQIIWLRVADPDDWILDHQVDPPDATPTTLSVTVNSQTGGLVVGIFGNFSTPSAPSGTTQVGTSQTVNGHTALAFSVDSVGASTTTVTSASYNFPTLFAVSVKASVSPWVDVSTGSGGTTSSYTTPTLVLGDSGTQYRLRATNAGGTVYSNTVTLTVTASSGYSLTVTPGSYSVTGSSASLVASRALSVTPASYAVTGSSANLARGFALSVTPASYSLSGSSASLVASRALSVTPGSYSVVGSDVDLTYTTATTAYELLVTPGSYSLTGSTASLTAERSLQTTPGAYSVIGANAGLTAGRVLSVTPASYAVSAQSASLVASRSLSVTPGAYALTGSPVELDYASTVKELIVLPGSYSLTGADVELEYQPVVQSSGHGFVMVDFEPRIWWMRKPKALDEEEAAEKVKEVAKKIERIVVRKIEQGKAIKTPELKAQVKEAIAPQVAQMPGFDWKALYAAILVRLMEQQAQELAQMELERIRLFEQDEEDALILLMA